MTSEFAYIGSVFRTADAFLIENILMWYYCPPPNKEIHKTALGATETVGNIMKMLLPLLKN
jgi:tRNA G18 (ribose-2'-O)-methylase SpoU